LDFIDIQNFKTNIYLDEFIVSLASLLQR